MTGTNIQALKHHTVHLQVEPLKVNILSSLLSLTWYHNESIILPTQYPRYTLSNQNKTLTITNFTLITDAGVYKAQFNKLFVHPFNEDCEENVLSLLRHLPVLKPAVFCVNMVRRCSEENMGIEVRTISVESVDQELEGTLNSIKLRAVGRVLNRKELQYSSIWWYRNGYYYSTSYLSTLQKHYNNLSLSQELEITNAAYEDSGRYEVLMQINMNSFLFDPTCRPYYNSFVSRYLTSYITLAKGYADIGYYKGIIASTCELKLIILILQTQIFHLVSVLFLQNYSFQLYRTYLCTQC